MCAILGAIVMSVDFDPTAFGIFGKRNQPDSQKRLFSAMKELTPIYSSPNHINPSGQRVNQDDNRHIVIAPDVLMDDFSYCSQEYNGSSQKERDYPEAYKESSAKKEDDGNIKDKLEAKYGSLLDRHKEKNIQVNYFNLNQQNEVKELRKKRN